MSWRGSRSPSLDQQPRPRGLPCLYARRRQHVDTPIFGRIQRPLRACASIPNASVCSTINHTPSTLRSHCWRRGEGRQRAWGPSARPIDVLGYRRSSMEAVRGRSFSVFGWHRFLFSSSRLLLLHPHFRHRSHTITYTPKSIPPASYPNKKRPTCLCLSPSADWPPLQSRLRSRLCVPLTRPLVSDSR